MPKTCIEIPQPTKRAPIVVDLEGNSAASVAGTAVAVAGDVLAEFIVTPALEGQEEVVSGRKSSKRISID